MPTPQGRLCCLNPRTVCNYHRQIIDTMQKANANLSLSIPIHHHSSAAAADSSPGETPPVEAPEMKLTLFAFRLAILEKAASGVGALGFVWATVVLLGGFAATLVLTDFLVITFILIIEGARIFSRSHELEWQHEVLTHARRLSLHNSLRQLTADVRTLGFRLFRHRPKQQPPLTPQTRAAGKRDLRRCDSARRTWLPFDVPLLPYGGWFSLSRNVSVVLYWLQLVSAVTCVGLSLWRLAKRDHTLRDDIPEETRRNLKAALFIFYSLALAEALLFLVERAYWVMRVTITDLFDVVRKDCGLQDDGVVIIKRFYYDAYSKCINGSIFDGLKMDLVTYGEELLVSDFHEQQLLGIRILQNFAINPRFAEGTLRKIETTSDTVERLIEMLNWNHKSEAELRMSAAEVVLKLVEKDRNLIRIVSFPGAINSISGLVYTGQVYGEKPHDISMRPVVMDEAEYEYSAFSLLGLSILKKLAVDHQNCWKIGSAKGLVAKIIDVTVAEGTTLRSDNILESRVEVLKSALTVVKLLASTNETTGLALRRQISEVVFTMVYMRQILQFGERHPELQKLAIGILTNLAVDGEARKKIGSTGGIVEVLLEMFLDRSSKVRVDAGEALAMLAMESEGNWDAILRMDVMGKLVSGLEEEEEVKIVTGRVLRNLCAYSGEKSRDLQLRGIVSAMPTVIRAILKEKGRSLEISIGLATQILKLATRHEVTKAFAEASVEESQIVEKLSQVIHHYSLPTMFEMVETPRIRRFAIELAIQMMEQGKHHIMAFKHGDFESNLKKVLCTTSSLESFNVFTGSVGLYPHRQTIHALVDRAIGMLSKL